MRVREWFAPVFAPDEVLSAALAGNDIRFTMLNSLIGTARMLVGDNPARVLLLTDHAIYVATRKFWKRRFKSLLTTYPLGSVSISVDRRTELRIGDDVYFLNPPGYQMGGPIGTQQDVRLFLAAGRRD